MLNIISIDNMPNEEQINQAERFFFLTMEVSKEYLINEDTDKKKIYQLLVTSLYQSLKRNDNFPEDEEELKKVVNFVFTEYLEKGMPSDDIEQGNDYYLLTFRMILAMACDERLISFCDKWFS